MAVLLVATGLLVLFLVVVLPRLRSRQGLPLPPGPKGLPLLGDLRAAGKDKHKYWYQLGKEYGPLVSVNIAGQTVIIINSHEVASDLMVKRSANYSGRPRTTFIEILTKSADWTSPFILTRQYGPEFKLHRRMLESGMTASYAPRFHGLMDLETRQLLTDLINDKDSKTGINSDLLYAQIERTQSSFIIGGMYGFRTPHRNDPELLKILKSSTESNGMASDPTLLNVFPSLKYLPEFLSPYKKAANRVRAYTRPWVEQHLAKALGRPGWNLAKQSYAIGMKEGSTIPQVEANLESNLYGGVETAPRELMWVIVAAITQRAAVRKAQAQIDKVVGPNRLPNFEDRSKLPYIDAFLKETLRWRPIMADSIPHRSEKDDEYNGYFIPGNSIVMANAWGINREAKYWGNDFEDFIPERWFKDRDVTKELRYDLPMPGFGYGRRVCAGRRVAEDGMYMQMSRMLWAFNFQEVEGMPVDPNADRRHLFTVPPASFKVRFEPRNSHVKNVIASAISSAETDVPTLLGEMDEKFLQHTDD